jgi:type I restriction enzyme R subunit
MSLHKEISFEDEVCEYLGGNQWLYEPKAAEHYDRARALYTPDLIAWVQTSQPQAWETLTKNHGADAQNMLLDRTRKQLDAQGTLDVLRYGVETVGLKRPIELAQFKPAFDMNEELTAKYNANRLRVVRQVRYSTSNENSIDLVLFLNGIPVATVELKTDFTQSVTDAIDQYKFDRDPKPKGQNAEPLLTFPSGALVHFAVSNTEVYMTTKLAGAKTFFLPFNKGNNGGAGNPPSKGHPTSYLWEEVWERHSWLEIIGRYLVAEKNDKKQIEKIIFPRYHQLDATRKLTATVLEEGAGHKYLIQHSAGSGKTNSISWTAHFLADLHKDNEKVFSTVIVVSDRNVIDGQLRDALDSFERTKGVVAAIKNEGGSKSQQLADALAQKKKIIVCTIQTFPFALEAVREQASAHGKTFAVIADEAHSSQAGTTAAKLRKVLSADEQKEMEDGGEVSYEDILAAEMAERANDKGITFVAFTATPKTKTLELFGRHPDPKAPNGPDNLPAPFHVYSMRQAIEEGFILDVLKNYTPYDLAFRLATGGKEMDEKEVEKSAALKSIMSWVRLHPHNIAQKVEIVVEHFRQNVAPLLNGKAKAMVVLASRKEAVRWQLAITKYIQSRNYSIGTLVAFSGEVNDPESGPDPFTEASKELNPRLNGKDIAEAFKGEDYHILLVANKFQTGFDQPLLCGMYVDRRLAGIQAVQTLSRLNRAHPGKDTTYILDFANSADDILSAFQTYYETASLEATTDPNVVFNLRAKLDAIGYYDDFEVDRVAKVEVDPKSKQSDLIAAIEPVANRLLTGFKIAQHDLKTAQARKDMTAEQSAKDKIEALVLFKTDMGAYLRLYTFLSQIFDYGNTDLEKRSIFYKRLIPLLEFGREREGIDTSQIQLTHHKLKSGGKRDLTLGDDDAPKLKPLDESGSGAIQEKEKARLSEIIERVNGLFEGQISDDDQLVYVNSVLKGKLLQSEELVTQAQNNSKAQFTSSPTLAKEFINAIIDSHEAHKSMSTQALNSERIQAGLIDILLGPGGLYEALRDRGTNAMN